MPSAYIRRRNLRHGVRRRQRVKSAAAYVLARGDISNRGGWRACAGAAIWRHQRSVMGSVAKQMRRRQISVGSLGARDACGGGSAHHLGGVTRSGVIAMEIGAGIWRNISVISIVIAAA